jgi:hypothetical protein
VHANAIGSNSESLADFSSAVDFNKELDSLLGKIKHELLTPLDVIGMFDKVRDEVRFNSFHDHLLYYLRLCGIFY